jgi:hypothetical protein
LRLALPLTKFQFVEAFSCHVYIWLKKCTQPSQLKTTTVCHCLPWRAPSADHKQYSAMRALCSACVPGPKARWELPCFLVRMSQSS